MAPGHISPEVTEGIMLEEEVEYTFVIEQPVGIVHPVTRRGEMYLWAEFLAEYCRWLR